MNTNIAESYAKNIVDTVNEFTKEIVVELVKQAFIDGANGVAIPEDTVNFVDEESDFIPTEDDIDINEFDAFTPSFMQK